LATVACCLAVGATAARAHVTLEGKEAKLGAGYKAVFSLPHGCEGSPTTEVTIDIPEGVIAVKPMPKPGWKLSLTKGAYARSYAFYHGETKSEGVKQVTWSGGELPDEYFDQFVLSTFVAGELAPGSRLAFPVTQKCAKGELRWHEVAAAGQDAHSLEHPAPLLLLVAGEGDDHHHHHGSAAATSGGIEITGPWTRPASAGGIGVGYAKVTNEGAEPDTLLGASSDAADRVELHQTTISADGIASMKKIDAAEIAPGGSVELKPGGLHLMLIGLKAPIADGDTVKAKLNFKNAGAVDIEFVAKTAPPAAGGDHEHMHHH
jgi:uncharacterized protein YcnI/copper(I)-binding protein